MLGLRPVSGMTASVSPGAATLALVSKQGVPMRPWASWTAKTALLAAGFAAAGGGLSGVALAGTGGSSTSGHAPVLSDDQLIAPATAVLPAIAPQTGLSGAGSGNVSAGRGNAVSIPVSL